MYIWNVSCWYDDVTIRPISMGYDDCNIGKLTVYFRNYWLMSFVTDPLIHVIRGIYCGFIKNVDKYIENKKIYITHCGQVVDTKCPAICAPLFIWVALEEHIISNDSLLLIVPSKWLIIHILLLPNVFDCLAVAVAVFANMN